MVQAMTNLFSKTKEARVTDVEYQFIIRYLVYS